MLIPTYSNSLIAQEFFYLSNLTEWSPYARPWYNKSWRRELPLSHKEKLWLARLRKLMCRYDYENDKYLGKAFIGLPENQVWQAADKLMKSEDLAELIKIFQVFEKRLIKLRPNWQKHLKRFPAEIDKALTKVDSASILKDLNILFSCKYKQLCPQFNLLLAPALGGPYVGGGANVRTGEVEIEINTDATAKDLEKIVMVAWHEIIHDHFAAKQLEQMSTRAIKAMKLPTLKNSCVPHMKWPKLIEETILGCLAPNCFFAEKYQGIKPKQPTSTAPQNIVDLSYSVYPDIKPQFAAYLKRQRPIDKQFIVFVAKSIAGAI